MQTKDNTSARLGMSLLLVTGLGGCLSGEDDVKGLDGDSDLGKASYALNALGNPGAESSTDTSHPSWSVENGTVYAYQSRSICQDAYNCNLLYPRTGGNRFFQLWGGSPSMVQTVGVSGGQIVNASAFLSKGVEEKCYLKVSFFGSTGNQLSPVSEDKSEYPQEGFIDKWTRQLAVRNVSVPNGAVTARFNLGGICQGYDTPNGNGTKYGCCNFDDAMLDIAKPDLVVTGVLGQQSGTVGNTNACAWVVVKNQGDANAGGFWVGTYVLGSSSKWVGAAWVTDLTVGDVKTPLVCGLGNPDLALPTVAGTYRWGANVDVFNGISESTETNNHGLGGLISIQ